MDDRLAKSGIHINALAGIFDGVLAFLERLHLAEAMADVYKAWPEIKQDIDDLIEDVKALIVKLRALI